MELNCRFKNIGLVIRTDMDAHIDDIKLVVDILSQYASVQLHCLDQEVSSSSFNFIELDALAKSSDLVISLGGDGTLLSAARALVGLSTPLLGINLGRLGFLADVPISEVQAYLSEVICGEYLVEQRFFITGQITCGDTLISRHVALNDIILHSYEALRMIEYEIYSDGDLIHTQRSDGVIVATPTGSTAYALSGGGPIMHPSLETLALVPICPHTLSNRPIILSANQTIELRIGQPDMQAKLAFDAQDALIVDRSHRITINRLPEMLTLLHPKDYDYFKILRGKLYWSTQFK